MAQSTITVTPPSPTPPTNMSFTGTSAPNPPNYTKATYNDPKNWGTGTPTSPPPFYDDGTAGALTAIATNTAALASGSGATAGGTGQPTAIAGGTYPWPFYGTGTLGDTPASTSVAAEGAGTVVVVTSPGSQSYAPTQQVSTGPNWSFSPNQNHASTLSPATNPTLASISPTSTTSGTGTVSITYTGTNFTPQSVGYANGVAMPTVFVSATSLTVTVTKKATAGTWPCTVVTGGVVTTAAQTLTFS